MKQTFLEHGNEPERRIFNGQISERTPVSRIEIKVSSVFFVITRLRLDYL